MKIAIITGASSGMGREALYQLANEYKDKSVMFWVIARRRERLEELRGEVPVPLRIFVLDLADPASVRVLSEALRREKPEVELLVNAAGFGKIGTVEEIQPEDGSGMVRVNCEAMCAVTREALPYMVRGGRILQFASGAAFLPQPGFAVYAATKAFVLSYSRALNREVRRRGITVTAVCPGPVRTEFFDTAESGQKMASYKALFMADPEKVVKAALRDSKKGKSVSVYGISMKLLRAVCKVVPTDALLFFMPGGDSGLCGRVRPYGKVRLCGRVRPYGKARLCVPARAHRKNRLCVSARPRGKARLCGLPRAHRESRPDIPVRAHRKPRPGVHARGHRKSKPGIRAGACGKSKPGFQARFQGYSDL